MACIRFNMGNGPHSVGGGTGAPGHRAPSLECEVLTLTLWALYVGMEKIDQKPMVPPPPPPSPRLEPFRR